MTDGQRLSSSRCLFKSLCLSHPSQLTLNQSNQIKSPQGARLWDGGAAPSLSLWTGWLPAESNKGLCWPARLKSLCSYSYDGKELERATLPAEELLARQPSRVASVVQVATPGELVSGAGESRKRQRGGNVGRVVCVLELAPTHTHTHT